MGQLWYDGCITTFTAIHTKEEKQGQLILEHHHKGVAGMCQVNFNNKTHPILTPTRSKSKKLLADNKKPEKTGSVVPNHTLQLSQEIDPTRNQEGLLLHIA